VNIHHAPWSRWFKTMWFKGSFAYEVQVGPVVVQWGHHPRWRHRNPHFWLDRDWR
jgi:pterin-4a-carbinolamine dehydratase